VLLFLKTAIGYTQSANPESIRTRLSDLKVADPAAAERYCTENLAQSAPALRAYLHVQRGMLRTALKRMPDARRDLDEAVLWTAQHPEDSLHPYALQALATWFQLNGRPDSAELCWRLALDAHLPAGDAKQESASQGHSKHLFRAQQLPGAVAGLLGISLLLGLLLFRSLRSQESVRKAAHLAAQQKNSLSDQLTEAEQHAQQKNQLFAQIAADIRTPLTLAKIPVELLRADHAQDLTPAAQALLRSINRNLDRLQEFAQEIAQIAEPEMQQAEGLLLQPVYLPALAADIRDSFDLLAQTRNIQFVYELQLASNAEAVLTDRNKVEKIILTLILQAFRATPRDGKISLELRTDYLPDSSIQMTCAVRDTGPHIPDMDLKDILRWHKRGRLADEGQSAILSFTGELSKRLGGQMQAENLLQAGVRIRFQTRCHPSPIIAPIYMVHAEANTPSDEFIPPALDKPTVHLVEDDAEMRHLILIGLQKSCQIIQHADAESLLMYLQDKKQIIKADLLVVDLLLPGADGLSLIRTIRRMPALQTIPIIAMTSSNLANNREQAFSDGADAYFTKPFNIHDLSIRVHSLLQRRAQILQGNYAETLAAHTHVASPAPPVSHVHTIMGIVPEGKKEWVTQLIGVIQKHMSNQDLDIALLAREMAVSERQLYRFAKSATTYSPNQLIHEVRLYSALNLLMTKHELPVAQVSLEVGFENPGYFSVVFKKRFGKNPSEIKNEQTT
jgi:DNA-binding response OmpR family regulator/signal transduction histidine kinase